MGRATTIQAALLVALVAISPGTPASAQPDGLWFTVTEFPLAPGPALGAAIGTAVTMDVRRGRALAFGGYGTSSISPSPPVYFDLNTVLELSLDDGAQVAVVATGTTIPAPRSSAAAAYDSLGDRLWMFGGRSLLSPSCTSGPCPLFAPRADLWSLDRSPSPQWVNVIPSGSAPAARYAHSLIVDPVGRRLIMFGGRDTSGIGSPFHPVYGDVWAMALDGPAAWSSITPTAPGPGVRWGHSAVYDPLRRRMLVFGGRDAVGPRTDVWALELTGAPGWIPLAISGPAPSSDGSAAYDGRRDRVIYRSLSEIAQVALSGPLAWAPFTPVSLGSPAPGPLLTNPSISIDALHDVIAMPFGSASPQTFAPYIPHHHLLVLDQAPPPATLAPVFSSVTFCNGGMTLRWQLGQQGFLYDLPHLERIVGTLGWLALGPATARDVAAGTTDYHDQGHLPGATYRYRIAWSDPWQAHVSDSIDVTTAPPPLDMSSLVHQMGSGPANAIHWVLGDDSLSWFVQPRIARRIDGGAWVTLAEAWPDNARGIAYTDDPAPLAELAEYELQWTGPRGTASTGRTAFGTIVVPAPVPALALSPPQPQPVQDVLVLRAEIPQGPPARLELYDLGGRRVRERAIEGYGVAQLVVGVSDLPAGLYVARLVQGDVARSTRVSLVP